MSDRRTFLIIDTNNMIYRMKFVSSGDPWTKFGLTLHIMFHSIKKLWSKYNATHVVFALDGRSWRKALYEPYKKNRETEKLEKTQQDIEEDEIFYAGINAFLDFIQNHTNCTVLYNEICEADDLIARFIQNHNDDDHVIVSCDTDFFQLVSNNVILYDGMKDITIRKDGVYNSRDKKLDFIVKSNAKIKTGNILEGEQDNFDPNWIEWALFLKIVRGDPGDNIFSAYPRASLNRIRKAFEDRNTQGFEWNNFMLQRWQDHNDQDHRVKDVFERNSELIDLTKQPEQIKEIMDETIFKAIETKNNRQVGLHLLKFAGHYQLQKIIDSPTTFSEFLSAKYI